MTPKNREVDRRDALSGDRTTPVDPMSLRTPCPETHGHEYWRPSPGRPLRCRVEAKRLGGAGPKGKKPDSACKLAHSRR